MIFIIELCFCLVFLGYVFCFFLFIIFYILYYLFYIIIIIVLYIYIVFSYVLEFFFYNKLI